MFFPNSQIFMVIADGYNYQAEFYPYIVIKNSLTSKQQRIGETTDLTKVLVYPVNESENGE